VCQDPFVCIPWQGAGPFANAANLVFPPSPACGKWEDSRGPSDLATACFLCAFSFLPPPPPPSMFFFFDVFARNPKSGPVPKGDQSRFLPSRTLVRPQPPSLPPHCTYGGIGAGGVTRFLQNWPTSGLQTQVFGAVRRPFFFHLPPRSRRPRWPA